MSKTADDQQLVDYLLGSLAPEQAQQIDEESVVDDDVAARLPIVEDDLVDAYVRGALTRDERLRFESHYLSSPRRRERVSFAARFVRAVDAAAVRENAAGGRPASGAGADETAGNADSPAPDAGKARRPRFWWQLSAVAASLVLTGAAALWVAQRPFVRSLGAVNAGAPARVADSSPRPAAVERPRPSAPPRARTTPAAQAIALLLLPQTRAAAAVDTLTLPAAAAAALFTLRLESDDFPRYQAGLKDPATNAIVWRSAWLATRASVDPPELSIRVPVTVLKAQHYSIDLIGRDPGGHVEIVGSYAFEMASR